MLLKNSRFGPLCHCVPIGPDQQPHNFNSLTIGVLTEKHLLAVESGGDGVFQQYRRY
jgi:hypothetical protein